MKKQFNLALEESWRFKLESLAMFISCVRKKKVSVCDLIRSAISARYRLDDIRCDVDNDGNIHLKSDFSFTEGCEKLTKEQSREFLQKSISLQILCQNLGINMKQIEKEGRLQESSFYDQGKWFCEREIKKGTRQAVDMIIPDTPEEMEKLFRTDDWKGKFRDFFVLPSSKWFIGTLSFEEFRKLMINHDEMTIREGFVTEDMPRTLENGAKHAIANNYFKEYKPGRGSHFKYYEQLLAGNLELVGNNRVVVISTESHEYGSHKKEDFSFYLHDGFGRLIPYMTLILEGKLEYKPVEAFFCVKGA
jgi:hypothetical protein